MSYSVMHYIHMYYILNILYIEFPTNMYKNSQSSRRVSLRKGFHASEYSIMHRRMIKNNKIIADSFIHNSIIGLNSVENNRMRGYISIAIYVNELILS